MKTIQKTMNGIEIEKRVGSPARSAAGWTSGVNTRRLAGAGALAREDARLYRPFVRTEPAWQAFDEARELFYAGRLAYRATRNPLNAVPLVRQSVLLLLRCVAASDGVTSTDREEIVAAAMRVEERESVLRLPIGRELQRLDELERRFATLGAEATGEEARFVERLVETMPAVLASTNRHLVRRKLAPAVRERRKLRYRVMAAGFALLAALGAALVLRGMVRSVHDIVAYGGVHGVYFSDPNFTQAALSRRDAKIDFDWGSASPGDPVPQDGFSVRWFGRLRIPAADTYTFHLESDDGSRLYLNDQLVVDNWGDHGLVDRSGSVKLPEGPVTLRVEYFDQHGDAIVRLYWSRGAGPRQVIPAEYFIR